MSDNRSALTIILEYLSARVGPVTRAEIALEVSRLRPDLVSAGTAAKNADTALGKLKAQGKAERTDAGWQLIAPPALVDAVVGPAPKPESDAARKLRSLRARTAAAPKVTMTAADPAPPASDVRDVNIVQIALTPAMRERLEAFVALGWRGMSLERAAQLFLAAALEKDAA